MAIKDCFKMSMLICFRKKSLLPALFLIWTAYQLVSVCFNYSEIAESKNQIYEIICISNDSKKDEKELEDIEGVRAASLFFQIQQRVEIDGYSGDIDIYGMDLEYLQIKYQDGIKVPLDSTMPYVIIDEKAMRTLKDQSGRKLEIDILEEYILQTISIGETSPILARICGIGEEEAGDETTVDQENRQSGDTEGGIYMTLDSFENVSDSMTKNSGQWIVYLDSGRNIDIVIKKIEKLGYMVEMGEGLEENVELWQQWNQSLIFKISSCISLFISGVFIIYYQDREWKQENENFVLWINSMDKKYIDRLLRIKNLVIVGGSMLLGYAASLLTLSSNI